MEDNVTKRGGLLGVLGQIYICVAVFLNRGHLLSQDVQIRKKKTTQTSDLTLFFPLKWILSLILITFFNQFGFDIVEMLDGS